MLRSSREKQLLQAGSEIGKQVSPDASPQEGYQQGREAAKQLGLKKTEERMTFFAGFGAGRAEAKIEQTKKHSRNFSDAGYVWCETCGGDYLPHEH